MIDLSFWQYIFLTISCLAFFFMGWAVTHRFWKKKHDELWDSHKAVLKSYYRAINTCEDPKIKLKGEQDWFKRLEGEVEKV